MKPIQASGVLVFRAKPSESFLLMRHADRLDLPKGRAEKGESQLECALRELEEETGIPADAVEIDLEFRFEIGYEIMSKDGPPRPKEVVIFLGELTREVEIHCTEHEGYLWHPWNPPHAIQPQTIDPLLAAVAKFREGQR